MRDRLFLKKALDWKQINLLFFSFDNFSYWVRSFFLQRTRKTVLKAMSTPPPPSKIFFSLNTLCWLNKSISHHFLFAKQIHLGLVLHLKKKHNFLLLVFYRIFEEEKKFWYNQKTQPEPVPFTASLYKWPEIIDQLVYYLCKWLFLLHKFKAPSSSFLVYLWHENTKNKYLKVFEELG